MLSPYRRHLYDCPHLKKGQAFTLCGCPIWCYGKLDSKPVRKSLQTSDWNRAAQRIELIERGGAPLLDRDRSSSVRSAVGKFLESCSRRNLAKSTLDSYEKTLEHLADALGDRGVMSIGVDALDAFAGTRKVKPRTWAKELETIRAFFAWACDRKMATENPAKKLRMPRVDEIATLPFADAEVSGLILACGKITTDNPAEVDYIRRRATAMVYALLYSGLRVSDVAQLRRASLDGKTGHLTLRQMKTGVQLKVLLHADAKAALESLPSVNPEYFFWSGRGDLVTCIKNMRRTIQRLGAIASVHAHPHRFRDTFAVRLLTNGVDIRNVQLLLGHTSLRTTEKHYAHFVAAHQAALDRAAATLDFTNHARPVLVKAVKNRRRDA